jgi:hypothetical protein
VLPTTPFGMPKSDEEPRVVQGAKGVQERTHRCPTHTTHQPAHESNPGGTGGLRQLRQDDAVRNGHWQDDAENLNGVYYQPHHPDTRRHHPEIRHAQLNTIDQRSEDAVLDQPSRLVRPHRRDRAEAQQRLGCNQEGEAGEGNQPILKSTIRPTSLSVQRPVHPVGQPPVDRSGTKHVPL